VCDEANVIDALLELCDHSLVSSHESETGMRFQMLETIREFAAEALPGEAAEPLARRHASYFLSLAQTRAAKGEGPEEAAAFDELEADLPNVRAAMDWALAAGHDDLVAQLAAALSDFLWRRGYWQEHTERIGAGLAAAERASIADVALIGTLLRGLARVAYDRGEIDEAESAARRGLAVAEGARSGEWQVAFLNTVALALARRGESREARTLLEESICLSRETDDKSGEGAALHNLGGLALDAGDDAAAGKQFRQALSAFEEVGDLRRAAEARSNLGLLAERAGHWHVAEEMYRDALGMFVQLGDVLLIAVSLRNLGEAAFRTGRSEEAARLLRPASHTLQHLTSAHAAETLQLLDEATRECGAAPQPSSAPWRQELMAAAEHALGA
jgi:tetratricopeptide (TPR) repeat protein